MNQQRIAVIVGSLRRESLNRRLADAVAALAPPSFVFMQVGIANLPLYNQDDDEHQSAPVLRLKADIASSQGVLFVTAEYNRSIPGVLKNAIDHTSRPFGHSAWSGKPAGIIGVSTGVIGTALAQQHLRNVLASLDMPTLCQPEVFLQEKDDLFDAEGGLGVASRPLLQAWMVHYASSVMRFCG